MAAGRKRVMRLPKGGQACPLPPVPGTTIAQHLANNSGAPVSTPPSVPQPSVAKPATATPPITTAARPWTPTKATSFTQFNQRTQQGATIVDLSYLGQKVGTLAQLPNGKWTVRDANGQGIGKQVHTSWLARKLLSDYLNTKGGNISPAPAPTQPAPIAPTPKPAPPLPTPPPAPAPAPKPAPTPAKTLPAVTPVTTPQKTPLSQFSSPDAPTTLKNAWATQQMFDPKLYAGRYKLMFLGSDFIFSQTNAYKGGAQTEWSIKVKGRGRFADDLPEITFASFVRIQGGFAARLNPEILKIWREQARIQNPRLSATDIDTMFPPEAVWYGASTSSIKSIAQKLFVRGYAGNGVKGWLEQASENFATAIEAKKTAHVPLQGTRELTQIEALQQGRIAGNDILWKMSQFELQEIAELHSATGRRSSNTSDAGLDKIAELQGWAAGRPTLTSLQNFYAEIKKGDHMWLRGDTTHKYASQYKLWAKMHYGKGVYGNGTYSAHLRFLEDAGTRGGWSDQIHSAVSTAKDYASGDHNVEGPITLGRLKRDAKIIDQEEFTKLLYKDAEQVVAAFNEYEIAYQTALKKNPNLDRSTFDENPDNFELVLNHARAKTIQGWMQDQNSLGLIAALHGVDAVIIYPTAVMQRHNWTFENVQATERGVSYYKFQVRGTLREYGPQSGWANARESSNQYTLLLNRSASIVASGDMHVWSGKSPTKSAYYGEVQSKPRPAKWSRLDPDLYDRYGTLTEAQKLRKLTLEQFLEDLHTSMQAQGDWQGHIQDWIERYERAIMRNGKAVTITFEESRGFEEIFAKEDSK